MIIPPGYANVAHVFELSASTQTAVVTYGVQLQGTEFGETRAALLHDMVDDHMLNATSTVWTLARTLLKYGPSSTGPLFEFSLPTAGRNPGAASPPQVAALIRKRTSFGGRSQRGRMYWPGMIDDNVDSIGELLNGYVLGFQSDINDWRTALAGNDLPMVLLHNASSDPTPVTSLNLDTTVATQRRRLR